MSNLRNTDKLYDTIIVGGGPAGLTAAIYLARAQYRVLVIEKEDFGGQITITGDVVNYPGVRRISGKDLTEIMRIQAQDFGAEFLLAEAESLDTNGDIKTVRTNRGEYSSFGILIATGAYPRTIGFKGESEFRGRGVAYCATCDGEFFTDKDVFVIGGGYAAAEESVFLTKYARNVTILIREEDFTCAKSIADQARNHPKINVITDTIVEEVNGENGLNYIRYKNTATGEITEFKSKDNETFGVFVFAGYIPETSLVKDIVKLDEQGYIITDRNQRTNISGLCAAGDICVKPLRQVVTAVGDGALAATELERYSAAMQRKTGLIPVIPQKKAVEATSIVEADNDLFSHETKEQLDNIFSKMAQPLVLKLSLDDRAVSAELESYMTSLAALTENLSVDVEDRNASSDIAPCVKICLSDGTETGLAFHGVPGGHEFTSFILGLYNAAGPGQSVDKDIEAEIHAIDRKLDLKVLVTLTCSMCPDLVTAVQRIASMNKNVTAEIFDLNHFTDLRDKYKVMSVPCLVINNDKVSFGKKNIRQVLELIENAEKATV